MMATALEKIHTILQRNQAAFKQFGVAKLASCRVYKQSVIHLCEFEHFGG
jgi:hypothetical protein